MLVNSDQLRRHSSKLKGPAKDAGPNLWNLPSLHIVVAGHLERYDIHRGLVGRHVGLQGDMVPFVALDRIGVIDRQAFAVLVAHESFSVITDFARDVGSFG